MIGPLKPVATVGSTNLYHVAREWRHKIVLLLIERVHLFAVEQAVGGSAGTVLGVAPSGVAQRWPLGRITSRFVLVLTLEARGHVSTAMFKRRLNPIQYNENGDRKSLAATFAPLCRADTRKKSSEYIVIE